MTEHTEQTAAPAGAVPARIDLEDFVEAVTRGVARALAVQDEVSGYVAKMEGEVRSVRPVFLPGGATIGLIFNLPTGSDSAGAVGGGFVSGVR